MDAQLNDWEAKIDEFKARADKAEANAKLEYHKRIDEAQAKRKAAEAKLAEMKAAGEEAGGNLKKGMEGALKDLTSAVTNSASKFKCPRARPADPGREMVFVHPPEPGTGRVRGMTIPRFDGGHFFFSVVGNVCTEGG